MKSEQNNFSSLITGERYTQMVDETYPPAVTAIYFNSHGKRLNGVLYQANGVGPHPTVILLHGYPGTELNIDLAHTLRRACYNVLIFHYRGAWGSDGEFSFSNMIEDVASASHFLRTNPAQYRVDANRLLLIGHSMGGFAALHSAARDPEIQYVAGIASADLGLVAKIIRADTKTATDIAASADNLFMLKGWNGKRALENIRQNEDGFDVVALAPKLSGKSICLIAADKDSLTPSAMFHTPMVAAYESQGDITLTDTIITGDHFFSWSRFELIDAIMKWVNSCAPVI